MWLLKPCMLAVHHACTDMLLLPAPQAVCWGPCAPRTITASCQAIITIRVVQAAQEGQPQEGCCKQARRSQRQGSSRAHHTCQGSTAA